MINEIMKRVRNTKGAGDCLNDMSCSDVKEILDAKWLGFPCDVKNIKVKSDPGKFAEEIKDTGERAAQRAYFFKKKIAVNGITIRWLDLEIPICPGAKGKARRKCIDLRGITSDQPPHPVIVEMKFAKNEKSLSDSPLYALLEGLLYCALAYKNCNNLKDLVHDNTPEGSKPAIYSPFPHLIVAANKEYWQGWFKRLEGVIVNLLAISSTVQRNLPSGTWIKFASFPNVCFKGQKRVGKKYKPFIPTGQEKWTELTLENFQSDGPDIP